MLPMASCPQRNNSDAFYCYIIKALNAGNIQVFKRNMSGKPLGMVLSMQIFFLYAGALIVLGKSANLATAAFPLSLSTAVLYIDSMAVCIGSYCNVS